VRNAPKQEAPKPLVEKQGEKKPVNEMAEKLTEKQEIVTQKEATPPPPTPEPKKAEPKPEPAPKPEKAEQKAPQPKVDPIAEALKKDEKQKKPEEKPTEAKAEAKNVPLPMKKPPPPKPQPKFDPAQVAALLDKRDPARHAATGDTVNRTASLGAPGANAPELSQSELDALRARLMQLWNPPIGIRNAGDMIIRVRVLLKPDGTLARQPEVITAGHGVMFESARDSAIRAVLRGQPFNMLRPQTYETWKDIEVTFDPRDMLYRG
jgi:colicin import membrane protein